ncbi:hypothetical protein BDV26DRAFT_231710 [Aspergillus bertholletiae]|uniref:Uncharacterized protein n=1 Tax=Aspergillus bertholletiae TaxID=1226010 RepID=A0A5N7B4Y4_9EURO|nr:hypothetical protein BDV26DRAFT_231710 [Aspergillus bertholletiae]
MLRPAAVNQLLFSDGQHESLASSRVNRSHPTTKQSLRMKTSYQLAQPPMYTYHRRLKTRPRLLFQFQQISHTPRPVPIVDVLLSGVALRGVTCNFPTIFRDKRRLGSNDLTVMVSEFTDWNPGSVKENGDHREAIATISQLYRDNGILAMKAEISLIDGRVLEATPLSNGSYEFLTYTEDGPQIFRWVLRTKVNPVSAPIGLAPQEDSKRFIFSMINAKTRRHPVLATLTRNCLEVFTEYSMPRPSSVKSWVSSSTDTNEPLDQRALVDDNMRTLIIVTSAWVAFRECWSYNLTYEEPVSIPISKWYRYGKRASRTASRAETEHSRGSVLALQTNLLQHTSTRPHTLSPTSNCVSLPTRSFLKPSKYGDFLKHSISIGSDFVGRATHRLVSNI